MIRTSALALLVTGQVFASYDGMIFSATRQRPVHLLEVIKTLKLGSVVTIGEQHDLRAHHDKQLQLIKEIINIHGSLNLGLEFFDYTQQSLLDSYLDGKISELEFLTQVNMKQETFDFYKPLIQAVKAAGGDVKAINLPRKISGRIANVGIAGLTQEEQSYLPRDFEIGNALYKERFVEAMGGNHGGMPQDKIDKFFEAQSAWDDTMAHQVATHVIHRSQKIYLVVIGNFHVEYGLGLPYRMQRRGLNDVVHFPQVNAEHYTQSELASLLPTHPRYGNFGFFTWISNEPK